MLELLAKGIEQLGLVLTPKQAQQFQLYYEELIEWNKRMNLTAINGYEQVQLKHFLDSLTLVSTVLDMDQGEGTLALMDVGTGAGFPGIPLKILLPKIRLALLDSVAKKTSFLHHLAERMQLDYVTIITGRAEEAAHQTQYREMFDMVVSRGLAKLPTAIELTLPFCRVGGMAIAQKMGIIDAEINRTTRAIHILGGRLKEVRDLDLELLEQRLLVIVEKTSPTPESYPRRTGVPAKRPL